MAIFSFGDKRVQQRGSTSATDNNQQRDSESSGRNRRTSNKFRNWVELQQLKLHNHRPWKSISVHNNLPGSRRNKPNCDSKNNRSYFGNRYHKYLYPVIALLVSSPVSAADVGGVSATANPIANSSGSVPTRPSRFYKAHISPTHTVVVSVVKVPLQTSHLILLMPQVIRILLKLSTWNLNMTTEILKVV